MNPAAPVTSTVSPDAAPTGTSSATDDSAPLLATDDTAHPFLRSSGLIARRMPANQVDRTDYPCDPRRTPPHPPMGDRPSACPAAGAQLLALGGGQGDLAQPDGGRGDLDALVLAAELQRLLQGELAVRGQPDQLVAGR